MNRNLTDVDLNLFIVNNKQFFAFKILNYNVNKFLRISRNRTSVNYSNVFTKLSYFLTYDYS